MLENIERAIALFSGVGNSILFANVNLFGDRPKIPLVIAVLLAGCFYFLFSLRFAPITKFKYAFKLLLDSGGGHGEAKQGVSSYRALFTSIAGAAGLGHLAGIPVGISIGGPGVVFWILVVAILCMPLRFAEVYLGHKYRFQDENGVYVGGPYWYMKNGLASLGYKKLGGILAIIYSICLVLSTYGGACSFQVNQATKIVLSSFDLPNHYKYIISGVICVAVAFIILGGIKRVAHYCSSAVMAFMSLYVIITFIVLVYYSERIPDAIEFIMASAFDKYAMYGGAVSVFIAASVRLLFANETGMGTAPSIHSSSMQKSAVKEAFIAMICPIIDVVFVCFVTGIIVCISGSFAKKGLEGITMVGDALKSVHPFLGYFIAIAIPFVALNVMIAWGYYGVKNLEFLCKTKKFSKIFLLSFCSFGFLGGIIDSFQLIVDFSNVINMAIVIPNMIAVFLMRKQVNEGLKKFLLNIKYSKNEED